MHPPSHPVLVGLLLKQIRLHLLEQAPVLRKLSRQYLLRFRQNSNSEEKKSINNHNNWYQKKFRSTSLQHYNFESPTITNKISNAPILQMEDKIVPNVPVQHNIGLRLPPPRDQMKLRPVMLKALLINDTVDISSHVFKYFHTFQNV